MVKVKICGITNLRDAKFCASHGADFLGFNFYRKSKRFIAPAKAKEIIERLGVPVFKVGIFVNEKPEVVRRIARLCRLDLLQFHGDESASYLKKFGDFAVIKALRVKDRFPRQELKSFYGTFLLFDTLKKGAFGGTGKTFDWEMLKKVKRPFFVSGGLTPENVRKLLKTVKPFAVDVAGGVESTPGQKDYRLVREFIKKVKGIYFK